MRFTDGKNDVSATTDRDGIASVQAARRAEAVGRLHCRCRRRKRPVWRRIHELARRHQPVGVRAFGRRRGTCPTWVMSTPTARSTARARPCTGRRSSGSDNDASYTLPAPGQPVTVTINDEPGQHGRAAAAGAEPARRGGRQPGAGAGCQHGLLLPERPAERADALRHRLPGGRVPQAGVRGQREDRQGRVLAGRADPGHRPGQLLLRRAGQERQGELGPDGVDAPFDYTGPGLVQLLGLRLVGPQAVLAVWRA